MEYDTESVSQQPLLSRTYPGKNLNKSALQKEIGLPVNGGAAFWERYPAG